MVNQALDNLWCTPRRCEMKWRSARMVSVVDISTFLLAPVLDVLEITIDNGLTKTRSIANVSHLCPVVVSNWVEAANFLATGVIFQKAHIARNEDRRLLFS
jgi:hypothetical protein